MADILNSFDIFGLPSLSEGLPVSLLEAMSMGLACVVTKAGGMSEIIEDGINGVAVVSQDTQQFISALRKVIGDKSYRHKLGAAARECVAKNFQPASYVGKVLKEYNCLING